MKKVKWTDKRGNLRCSLLRDDDDENKPEIGIPLEPPPLDEIADVIVKELRNELVARELLTFSDIEANPGALTGAILSVFRRRLILLYREKESRNA